MYKKKSLQRTNINNALTNYFSGVSNKYSNNQLAYLENLKKELEGHKTKVASILYRKQLKEHQDKVNYTNEVNRLRGILSSNDTRLPIGTVERLKQRVEELKKLGVQIN